MTNKNEKLLPRSLVKTFAKQYTHPYVLPKRLASPRRVTVTSPNIDANSYLITLSEPVRNRGNDASG